MTRRTRTRAFGWHAAGLLGGPLVAVAVYAGLGPAALGHEARAMAAVTILMALWWVTEVVPLAATALLPIVCFPLLGVAGLDDTAARYAHPLIFLFLGGLILGKGLERWDAHKRLALWIILLVGAGPRRIVAGVMLATALVSAFVSNTASAMMMLPIVASIGSMVIDESNAEPLHARRFRVGLLLALAYGCSIGGMATVTGTPPNGIMVAFLDQQLGVTMSYARWLRMGVPVAAVLLPLGWLYLVHVAQPLRLGAIPGGGARVRAQLRELGPVSRPELLSVLVFGATALAWVTHGWIEGWLGLRPIDDAVFSIAGAMLLFIIPSGRGPKAPLLRWDEAAAIPWGVLILFGGGLALAHGVTTTGLDAWIGQRLAALGDPGEPVMLAGTSVVVVLCSEIASNTATTSAMLPVFSAAAAGLGVPAAKLVVLVALSSSAGFMLPVATPPNAIVFSTGRISVREMALAGLGMNAIAIVVITLMVWLFSGTLLGLDHAVADRPAVSVPLATP